MRAIVLSLLVLPPALAVEPGRAPPERQTARVSSEPTMRAIVLSLLVSLPALAAEPERPWARGVPLERQSAALELFRDANAKLRDALYTAARDRYLEALKAWDHPAIHYNLSLSLMNLDQPVEAYEHLLLALKYGAAPLDAEKMDQATRYRGLVERQLARLTVKCELDGATVRIDGNPITLTAGRWEGVVRSGRHSIVASREGYLPTEKAEKLLGGEVREVALSLYRTQDLTAYRRQWPEPIPWVVVAAGLVVTGAGVGLHVSAKAAFNAYDAGIVACASPETLGCVPRPELTADRTRGEAFQGLAITSYAIGGAALVTGAVLLYLNRLQPYTRAVDVPSVSLLPSLSPGNAGATLLVSF